MFERLNFHCFIFVLSTAIVSFASAAERVSVFVSVAPHAYFVEQIAGDLADVHVMVSPGQNPHTYEPKPKQMTQLSESQLFFHTGVPFEDVWLPRIKQNFPTVEFIDLQQNVDLLTTEEACTDPHHNHDQGHHHHHDVIDPHIWLSPNAAMVQAKTIYTTFAERFPEKNEALTKNYDALIEELTALDSEIRDTLSELTTRRFYVYHPAWGYFAHDYGLEQVAIELDGKEPSARQLGDVIDHAKKDGVRVIFVQQQFSKRLAQSVAESIGGTVTSIDPLSQDYVSNLRLVAKTLSEAMR